MRTFQLCCDQNPDDESNQRPKKSQFGFVFRILILPTSDILFTTSLCGFAVINGSQDYESREAVNYFTFNNWESVENRNNSSFLLKYNVSRLFPFIVPVCIIRQGFYATTLNVKKYWIFSFSVSVMPRGGWIILLIDKIWVWAGGIHGNYLGI